MAYQHHINDGSVWRGWYIGGIMARHMWRNKPVKRWQ